MCKLLVISYSGSKLSGKDKLGLIWKKIIRLGENLRA